MATRNESISESHTVRLTPFTYHRSLFDRNIAATPFRDSPYNGSGSSGCRRHPRCRRTLPCSRHVPERCPSRRPFMSMLRSRFTRSPGSGRRGCCGRRVSCMAVTWYRCRRGSGYYGKAHPLCDTDWSIFSSSTNEHVSVKCTLPPSRLMAVTFAASSTIPENIIVKC